VAGVVRQPLRWTCFIFIAKEGGGLLKVLILNSLRQFLLLEQLEAGRKGSRVLRKASGTFPDVPGALVHGP